MRIHEILIESQQLDEGPLGAIGRGIGKVVGGVAKGVGAVAGGIAGAGTALKKGYQTGKAVVGDDPDPNKGQPGYDGSEPAAPKPGAPAAAAAPAAAPAAGAAAPAAGAAAPAAGAPPSAQDINAAGPAGTAPAKPQTGAAGAALAKTDAVTDKQTSTKAGETVYAQVKANVDKLDKKGKQRILQLLTKSMAAPDPKAAPAGAPKPGAAPAGNYDGKTGAPLSDKAKASAEFDASPAGKAQQAKVDAMGTVPAAGAPAADPAAPAAEPAATAAPANTMANAPVSATNTAAADNPNQPPPKKTGGKVAGQVSQTPGAIAKREKRQAAAAAKATSNRVMGNMVNTLQQQNAGKVNYGNALSEALARRVEIHKQKMFETGLSQGTTSIFRK